MAEREKTDNKRRNTVSSAKLFQRFALSQSHFA
nr:MAG TPA: hypothetical protein [Caudoviricetes sp.]